MTRIPSRLLGNRKEPETYDATVYVKHFWWAVTQGIFQIILSGLGVWKLLELTGIL